MSKDDRGTGAGTLLMAFLVGAAAGAAVALLYAPAAGRETRERLSEKAREGARRASDAARAGRGRDRRHQGRLRAGVIRRAGVNTWATVFLGIIAAATLITAVLQVVLLVAGVSLVRRISRVRRFHRNRGQADHRPHRRHRPRRLARREPRPGAGRARRSAALRHDRAHRAHPHNRPVAHRQRAARGECAHDGLPRGDGRGPRVPAPPDRLAVAPKTTRRCLSDQVECSLGSDKVLGAIR